MDCSAPHDGVCIDPIAAACGVVDGVAECAAFYVGEQTYCHGEPSIGDPCTSSCGGGRAAFACVDGVYTKELCQPWDR